MTEEPALPASPEDALAEMDAWWSRWNEFLDEQAGSDATEVAGADGWTLAEAVAHVGRWQEWSVARAATLAGGARLEQIDVDGQNAAWAEQDRGIPFAEARARGERAHAAFRGAIAGVEPQSWSRALGRLVVANTSEHYREHMAWHGAPPGG